MDFALTDEQKALRAEIIRFAAAELNEGVGERDLAGTFRRDLWARCGEIGLHGLIVPSEYGGVGLDAVTAAVALEALGYGCEDAGLVFSLSAQLLACTVSVVRFGTETQKRRYLPPLVQGSLIAANAMSEPDSGSDAFAMRTRADPDGDGFRLNGTKTFATNGPVADFAVVYAVTDPETGYHGGITAFLVEADSPGYSAGRQMEKMGLRSSPTGEIVLDDVFVPGDAVLGRVGEGASIFVLSMDWERACLPATHVGALERVLERAIDHARTRKQGGRPIGQYQAVAHQLADVKVQLDAARLLVLRAAWALDHVRRPSAEAAMAKLFTSESLVAGVQTALRVHGGYGFMREYPFERYLRDAVGSTLYSGTSEIQRNIISGWLGLSARD